MADVGHDGDCRAARRLLWFTAALAVLSALGTFLSPLFSLFTIGFTWQASVCWCKSRWLLDGRNVWEATSG